MIGIGLEWFNAAFGTCPAAGPLRPEKPASRRLTGVAGSTENAPHRPLRASRSGLPPLPRESFKRCGGLVAGHTEIATLEALLPT